MITHQEIKNLVTEWGLRESIIEKDYVIGWVLWGIGSDPELSTYWAFKSGTSLKKCYIETWRFSEDLDFTVIPGGLYKPEDIEPLIKRILERVYDESGIDFSIKPCMTAIARPLKKLNWRKNYPSVKSHLKNRFKSSGRAG